MGDFNIEQSNCLNKTWLHLVQLFDLKQMVSSPTRVTNSSGSIIDHIYCTDSEKISECFVPHYSISGHFPICLIRKINQKLKKSNHITTSYRCYKHFNEELFLNDLADELSLFSLSESDIDDLYYWVRDYNKSVMTYKALHNLTPSYLSDLLTPKAQINNRTLRSSEDGFLAQPKARAAFYTGYFTFSAPKLWNNLHTAVKLAPSLNALKRAAKEVF